MAYADYLATLQELGRVAPRFSAGAVQEETGEYAKYRERWETASRTASRKPRWSTRWPTRSSSR